MTLKIKRLVPAYNIDKTNAGVFGIRYLFYDYAFHRGMAHDLGITGQGIGEQGFGAYPEGPLGYIVAIRVSAAKDQEPGVLPEAPVYVQGIGDTAQAEKGF
jgi:hypothetical protein